EPEPATPPPRTEVPDEPPPPVTQPTVRPKPLPPPAPSPGRGGKQHKHLQQMLKQWAEGMGWGAEIEKQILEGAGSVDVALKKGPVTVACEISVTTGIEQEVAHIEKCLKAGFTYVVALSSEAKQVEKIRQAALSRLDANVQDRVRFLTVEEFLSFIEEIEAQTASHESTHRGYRVRVKYNPVDDKEKKARKQNLSQVLLDSLKKMKK
ncbi:MAG TPA: hypothetical protein PKH31_13370, partial [Candidatus Sumerlaeota bacterium]|nr:hypothetical protein [Candidatus Sumerlaeota bacterium]